ncbi:thioredoxin-dependent thiol peroxidase [Haploplasma axanthum]|uniref:thioredoxin-dependent peroxiredoxin n=1 Tax=Haploplasma axanthum TaxID=29552 RepID=A0A449BD14_HAPAX|nr:thioredoxin-dependent thiol peroxidase [Haploplasma axanthum]VEU80318.1 AhpC/TSA family protein [Haploplasma axanthum]
MLKKGDKVKDFTLLDANGVKHSLSDYLGKKVVVYFYPKNDTPGCTSQACGFRDEFDLYREKGIVILGISKDDVKSHEDFKNKYHLPFTTLSDESLDVIKYFGAYGEKKMFGKPYMGVLRSTFVIDEEGKLLVSMPKVDAKNNAKDVLKAIEEA